MRNSKETIDLLHEQYQFKQKKEKWKVHSFQLAIFILFFSGWETSSRQGWIDPLIFSSPSAVWRLLLEKLGDGSLLSHIGVTLFETVLGFLLGTFMGTCLAALLWWSNRLARILDPYLVILNAMPKVALGPILIVALGPSFISIIAMGAII
ncbi:ABC transporter permease, partial [Bacillus subtilis]